MVTTVHCRHGCARQYADDRHGLSAGKAASQRRV